MDTSYRRALRRILIALDAASIIVAMVAAMIIQSALRDHIPALKSSAPFETFLLLGYLTLPMWIAIAAATGLYQQLESALVPSRLFRDLVTLHVFGLLGLALLVYLTQIRLNRSIVALFMVLTFALMFAIRVLMHGWLTMEHRRGHGRQRILLIADSREAVETITNAISRQPLPPSLIGCLAHEDSRDNPLQWGVAILGSPKDLGKVLHNNAVDMVLVSCSREVVVEIDALLEACDDVGVHLHCHVRGDHRVHRSVRVTDDLGFPTITYETRRRSTDALVLKRAFDIVIATASLIVLSPAMILISLGIRLSMGRPVVFRQERTGYNGRVFVMYKFRTMVHDAENQKAALAAHNEIDGPAFKIRRDPRVTPFGRFLRRTSLDELPQLFNVLMGRMSLVGPRPLPVGEQQRIHGSQRRRLSMKPGITGLWQVSGRSDLSFDEWMRLDLNYVDNWSFCLDMRVLAKTIPAVFTARGAS